MYKKNNFMIIEDQDLIKPLDLSNEKGKIPTLKLDGEEVQSEEGLGMLISHGVLLKRIDVMANELLTKFKDWEEIYLMVVKGSGKQFYDYLTNSVIKAAGDSRKIHTSFIDPSAYVPGINPRLDMNKIELNYNPKGKEILVLSNSACTLNTAIKVKNALRSLEAKRVLFWSLISKPSLHVHPEFVLDNTGFKLPSVYVLGFGFDKDGRYRDLKDLNYNLIIK